MVSSFLAVNHYFLINFNYVVSAVLQTQLFQGRLLATWNYTVIVRMQYYTKILTYIYIYFMACYAIAIELELHATSQGRPHTSTSRVKEPNYGENRV